MQLMKHKALFLDRDGVINASPRPGAYVCSIQEFYIRKGIVELVRRARTMGYLIVVVTNQRGVSRGHMSHNDLDGIHTHMQTVFAAAGAPIDAVYVCAHGFDECDCRKPKPGMLVRAAEELGIDLALSIMIGDMPIDIEAGKSAGCHTHLLTI